MTPRPLFDADYAAIEARIVCWLAGQEDALDEYRQGVDRYKVMASLIYNVPVDQVSKHPQRFVGKTTILGAGFGMGPPKFRAACKKYRYDLPLGLEDTAIAAFREKHSRIKSYWYDVENAAQRAIANRGQIIRVTNKRFGNYKVPVSFLYEHTNGLPFLFCKLPSGRKLAYPRPRLVASPKFEGKLAIKFFGHIIGTQWGDVDTYGGKLVENCLIGSTQVLSRHRGWIRLDSVTKRDAIFDGVAFVEHHGLVSKGEQDVIRFHGMEVTPEHRFKTKAGEWESACTIQSNMLYSVNEITFLRPSGETPRVDREHLREPVCSPQSGGRRQENTMGMPLRMRKNSGEGGQRIAKERKYGMRVSLPVHESSHWGSQHYARHDAASCLLGVAKHERPLPPSNAPSMAQLRGAGNLSVSKLGRRFLKLLARYGTNLFKRFGHRPEGQQRELHTGKLPLDNTQKEHSKQTQHFEASGGTPGLLGRGTSTRDKAKHPLLSATCGVDLGANTSNSRESRKLVYDIMNCGPRNQFAVRGEHGGPILLAHNCTQAVAADIMCQGAHNAEKAGFEIMALIHDQALAYTKVGQTAERFVECLTDMPEWANGLPIEAEGGTVPFYKKD